MESICGMDCAKCEGNSVCKGCAETKGRPFGAECVIAGYCKKGMPALNEMKKRLMEAFNGLNIQDMDEVADLNAVKGSFINIKYTLPNGQLVKIWDDDRIYFGNQLRKKGSNRYYGIAADEKYLMVSEYSDFGLDAEIIVFKRWN